MSRTLPLAEGGALSIQLTIGEVRILGEARADAAIEVVRQAPDAAALARIPVSIETRDGVTAIAVLQPDGGTDPAFRSDVTLRVPARARIDSVQIIEGRLELRDFAGAIRAFVQRGPIDASDVAGTLRLETEIGPVTVRRARLTDGGLLRLRTFNGDVRLDLAERPQDARILALALNGGIESTIPLNMKDTWGPRWGETTLGRGEPVISIDVVTGNISIQVADGRSRAR